MQGFSADVYKILGWGGRNSLFSQLTKKSGSKVIADPETRVGDHGIQNWAACANDPARLGFGEYAQNPHHLQSMFASYPAAPPFVNQQQVRSDFRCNYYGFCLATIQALTQSHNGGFIVG